MKGDYYIPWMTKTRLKLLFKLSNVLIDAGRAIRRNDSNVRLVHKQIHLQKIAHSDAEKQLHALSGIFKCKVEEVLPNVRLLVDKSTKVG